MDKTLVCSQIDQVIKELNNLKDAINGTNDIKVLSEEAPAPTTETTAVPPEPAPVTVPAQEYSDFDSLKTALLSDKWPSAVNPNLICDPNSEVDKKERGIGVVELLVEDPLSSEDKFLDYGCGEGHCAAAAASVLGCKLSVGYDPKPFNWPTVDNTTFTSSYDEVMSLGPYKAILIFDVLDHVENSGPSDLLIKAANLLTPDGKIYIRCHPWTSRHGTHHYHKLNKAFVHLVFNESELNQLTDYEPDPNLKITFPMHSYKLNFDKAGLKILSERKITEKVESFFKIPKISERIIKNTGHEQFPEFQMGLQFVDYVLSK